MVSRTPFKFAFVLVIIYLCFAIGFIINNSNFHVAEHEFRRRVAVRPESNSTCYCPNQMVAVNLQEEMGVEPCRAMNQDLLAGRLLDRVDVPLCSDPSIYQLPSLGCWQALPESVSMDWTYGSPWYWNEFGCKRKVFQRSDIIKCLKGRRVVFAGDSLSRGLWCDFHLWLEGSNPRERKVTKESGLCIVDRGTPHERSTTAEIFYKMLWATGTSSDGSIMEYDSLQSSILAWKDNNEETAPDVLIFSTGLWAICRMKKIASPMARFKTDVDLLVELLESNPLPKRTRMVVRGFSSVRYDLCGKWNYEDAVIADTYIADKLSSFSRVQFFSVLNMTALHGFEGYPDGMHLDPNPRPDPGDKDLLEVWTIMGVSRQMNNAWLNIVCES